MITIRIETTSDAFSDGNRDAELARILHELAAMIELGRQPWYLRDINGNGVCHITW